MDMIEVRELADLQKLAKMQEERPEKVLLMIGEVERVVLVKEREGDMEHACQTCFFLRKTTLCFNAPCEGVLFRKIELEE